MLQLMNTHIQLIWDAGQAQTAIRLESCTLYNRDMVGTLCGLAGDLKPWVAQHHWDQRGSRRVGGVGCCAGERRPIQSYFQTSILNFQKFIVC